MPGDKSTDWKRDAVSILRETGSVASVSRRDFGSVSSTAHFSGGDSNHAVQGHQSTGQASSSPSSLAFKAK